MEVSDVDDSRLQDSLVYFDLIAEIVDNLAICPFGTVHQDGTTAAEVIYCAAASVLLRLHSLSAQEQHLRLT